MGADIVVDPRASSLCDLGRARRDVAGAEGRAAAAAGLAAGAEAALIFECVGIPA
jgi:hypothetical protein